MLPNKAKSVTRSLIKDAALRTTLTTDQLMDLQAKTTRTVFSSCMVHLEADPHNIFRRKAVLEKRDPPMLKEDSRYLLLHDLITAFVINDPQNFWELAPQADEASQPVSDRPNLDELFGGTAVINTQVIADRPNLKWNDQQSKALKAVFKWYKTKSKNQIFRLFGFAGTGKEQPESCVVQTINGPKPLGTVLRGDLIYGRNGKLTRIVGVYPQGVKDVYEMTFSDGTSTRCGLEHLWTIADQHGRYRTVTTEDLLSKSLKNAGGYKYRVPLCGPVQYPARDLPVDPYVMGVMLGDGSFRGSTLTVTIGDTDESIIDELRERVPDHEFYGRQAIGCTHYTVVERKPTVKLGRPTSSRTAGIKYRNGFKHSFRELGLLGLKSGEKFIPRDYLLSCESDRLALLRGLMDTDGTMRSNNGCSFSTKSLRLANGLRFLVQSLGGIAIINTCDRTHDQKGIEYNVSVKLMVNPFYTPRKADAWTPPKQNIPVRGIASIRKVGRERQLCIKVSAKDELYLTDNFIVTHNTTLAKEIAWCIENAESGGERGQVLFAAYTGKAASVLASKGCLGATTLHSLIYKPQIDYITGKVKAFSRNPESPLCEAKLLICDEMSMVNDELGTDLLSFGIPILVLGDPAQVKPVKGEGFFTRADPDFELTDIERVAAENPLIWLATEIRNGRLPKPGKYGESRVYRPGFKVTDELITGTDQIIVGLNRTRQTLNRRHRKLNGKFDLDTQFPVRGDKLMCTKNNKQNGFLNGTQWTCSTPEIKPVMKLIDHRRPELGFEATRIEGLHFKVRALDLFNADGSPSILDTVCSTHHFDESLPEPYWKDIAGTDAFTFAYAGTVHKLQGSQFEKTLVIDESQVFADQRWNHLYTAATRASEEMHLVLSED